MSSLDLVLPAAFTELRHSEQRAELDCAHARLASLETQLLAFQIAAVFDFCKQPSRLSSSPNGKPASLTRARRFGQAQPARLALTPPFKRPLMTPFELTLPNAFFELQESSQRSLIDEARERLERLDIQLLTFQIAALFDELPELSRLIFFVDEDHDGYMSVDFACDKSPERYFSYPVPFELRPGSDELAHRSALLDRLWAFKERFEQTYPAEALRAFHRVELARPASGPVAPALLQAVLSPKDFAAWQACLLEHASSPASAESRKPASL